MNVQYCDLCGLPIKALNFYQLYINSPKNNPPEAGDFEDVNVYAKEYDKYLVNIQKDTKEVCPTCKHIFDKIFELRLQRLSELAVELKDTYNLTSKKNPIERDIKKGKNGKEKK